MLLKLNVEKLRNYKKVSKLFGKPRKQKFIHKKFLKVMHTCSK